MSDYIKEKVGEQEQKLLGSLNLFAMAIDREGYTPEVHQRFTKRILEDFQSSLQEMEEREEYYRSAFVRMSFMAKELAMRQDDIEAGKIISEISIKLKFLLSQKKKEAGEKKKYSQDAICTEHGRKGCNHWKNYESME